MIGLAEPSPVVATILRALVGMNNSSAWSTPAYSHQHCVEYELAGYCRSRRPSDDLSGIHDHGEIEPSFPGSNVRNIRNPSSIWTCDVELALKDVWNQLGWLGCAAVPDSIASNRPDFIYAHQPHHAVLAAGLSSLSKVEEYPWGSVDTVACRIRGADQPEEPNVLQGPPTDRSLSRSDAEQRVAKTFIRTSRGHSLQLTVVIGDLLCGSVSGHGEISHTSRARDFA